MIEKSHGFWPRLERKNLKLMAIGAFAVTLLSGWLVGFSDLRTGERAKAAKARAEKERQWLMGEGVFFVRKGCVSCHSIRSLGIEAANIGPDLSDAVVDVERRFGKTLEEFLDRPNGTMSIVLATRIPLTEAEKKEAIETLRIAYQRKLERQAQLAK
jgi:hypothetical protein